MGEPKRTQPEVSLRGMRAPEYARWKALSLADYAQDLIASGQCAPSEAAERAEAEFDAQLTDGLSTAGNELLVAESADGVSVGVLWSEAMEAGGIFLADFVVYEEHRRKGYGGAMLAAWTERLRAAGVSCIRLHVFAQNLAAVRLYERAGFVPVESEGAQEGSRYMHKRIECTGGA